MATLEEAKEKAKFIGKRMLLIGLISALVLGAMYYFYRTYTYSDGTRTGILVKISRKGNIFKTYEGQLHVGGVNMVNKQSIFDFSVATEEAYNEAQALEGKNVRVHYKQLKDAFFWQGDTDYMVYDVEEVK
jgi:hypothetical protein